MDVDSHPRRGLKVDITTDASPWDTGAFISINGVPTQYFAVAATKDDTDHLGIEFTQDSKVQQAFEALTLFIALRIWKDIRASTRCVVHVAWDNMAALAMMCKLQPHSNTLGIIARELALDICDSLYEPDLVSHIPGVANKAADSLSRKYQPDTPFVIPPILSQCVEVHPEARTGKWWRTARLRQGGNIPVATTTRPSQSTSTHSSYKHNWQDQFQ